MTRTILNDDTWQQLQSIMIEKGCYATENSRNVMEAILWKLRTGRHGVISLKIFVLGKPLIIDLIAGQKMDFGTIFF